MKNSIFILVLLSGILFSCGSKETINITGDWSGVAWKVDGKDVERNVKSISFKFNADGTYEANKGQQKEAGLFEVNGNQLSTTAKDQLKKKVEINLSGTDTLIMDMNRAGTAEQLILVKNK